MGSNLVGKFLHSGDFVDGDWSGAILRGEMLLQVVEALVKIVGGKEVENSDGLVELLASERGHNALSDSGAGAYYKQTHGYQIYDNDISSIYNSLLVAYLQSLELSITF